MRKLANIFLVIVLIISILWGTVTTIKLKSISPSTEATTEENNSVYTINHKATKNTDSDTISKWIHSCFSLRKTDSYGNIPSGDFLSVKSEIFSSLLYVSEEKRPSCCSLIEHTDGKFDVQILFGNQIFNRIISMIRLRDPHMVFLVSGVSLEEINSTLNSEFPGLLDYSVKRIYLSGERKSYEIEVYF